MKARGREQPGLTQVIDLRASGQGEAMVNGDRRRGFG